MPASQPDKLIANILKHDAKQNTYKIALLRAINDVVLAYPGMLHEGRDVAIPLRMLARHWIAYYWAFTDPAAPIYQASRWERSGSLVNDVAFRPELERLRQEWQRFNQTASPADGFSLTTAMLVPRKVKEYTELAPQLVRAYDKALRKVMNAIEQPTRYAGTAMDGTYAVFKPHAPRHTFDDVTAILGTAAEDRCIVIPAPMWEAFQELSLYVEALCIHEWSVFIEGVDQKVEARPTVKRGEVFQLLTNRPDNRVSLTWERNRIDLLLQEGVEFTCVWTQRPLTRQNYHLDHLIPVAVYPMNELWNLVPTHASANQKKSDKIPTSALLHDARRQLAQAYRHYQLDLPLKTALREDSAVRFASLPADDRFTDELASETIEFMDQIAYSRSLARIESF